MAVWAVCSTRERNGHARANNSGTCQDEDERLLRNAYELHTSSGVVWSGKELAFRWESN